ncbi:hypothetical protein BDQ12DRAFT_694303 [Crucibulum laeve]|uniref:Uncharacterized protein n=1 Tax=Crucibulum laeve TaxID=68775 RepID=A0A5C3LE37_9AGAR|nr:hypothetical protein BDQ12DRAFT_694303 [Crucibulum laeve]
MQMKVVYGIPFCRLIIYFLLSSLMLQAVHPTFVRPSKHIASPSRCDDNTRATMSYAAKYSSSSSIHW